uniref:Uncharacterized protein n=1 Tax=Rhizophora mucronata TaxID=61149 RepID=A0A2P2NVB2_RHIMU
MIKSQMNFSWFGTKLSCPAFP